MRDRLEWIVGRIACRLGHHNRSCRGRDDHIITDESGHRRVLT